MARKLIKIFLSLFLLFDIVFASEIDVKSDKYILYNMNENEILLEKDSHKEANIASLTKIMTVIVSIENIDNFDKKITITNEMINDIAWDVAVAGFKVGDTVTYNDLLYGSILSSGADAVQALAISIAGSKSNFVSMMNEKVKELGLKNTKFANVVGLYDKDNYSSAYDMAQILIYSLKNKKFKSVFETKKYTFTNGKTTYSTITRYNQNSGSNISYITGSKTGYINAAGYCLATTATINDVNYLLITLNAFSSDHSIHIKDTTTIYKYFSNNYGYKNIVDNDTKVVTLKAKGSKEKELGIEANVSKSDYLSNDFSKNDIKYEYTGVDTVSIFTKVGTKLGKVKIIYKDEVLDEFDLIYNQTLKFNLFGFIWSYKLQILICAVIIWFYLKIRKYKKRHRRKNDVKTF